MRSPQPQTEPIGDLVGKMLRSAGLSKRNYPKELPQAWAEIVGPTIARNARVLGLKKQVLLVEVESSTLSHELAVLMKEEILQKLRAHFPNKNIRALKCILHQESGTM